jgi:CRISPR-associated protein Cmr5
MAAIVNCDRAVYLRAQAETLAWLEWLKKFAVAFLG